ncbi:stalk domain-containing protein [Paenibacillus ihuae]|uniref:stalk domain-containing protein n=1 Tax=Paenibacillus ihuae TaxID=1232431 RepID=UPI0006D55AF6|nr:stalk domain-containing protein [Paenibacillus ihuae]
MSIKLNVKSITMLLLVCLLTVMAWNPAGASAKTAAAKTIRVYVQDKEIHPKTAPVIQGGKLYVEFRSAVQALGFSFKYDAVQKVITAVSEDASFKIDLKAKKAYVNNISFSVTGTPVFIGSGADIMVLASIFQSTSYINADYDQKQKTVRIYVDLQGKPKKSDLKKIRALLEAHYQTATGLATIQSLNLETWGTYTTFSADVLIHKSGGELLDRIEHAEIEMEHKADKSWTIHNITSDTEYLDYTSLAHKEISVPDVDKMAIISLLAADFKARNEENIEALLALQNPAGKMFTDYPDLELVREYLKFTYDRDELKYNGESTTIVAYEPARATVYSVYNLGNNAQPELPKLRLYVLVSVVKSVDGVWYMNPDEDIILDSEIVK